MGKVLDSQVANSRPTLGTYVSKFRQFRLSVLSLCLSEETLKNDCSILPGVYARRSKKRG